MTQSASIEQLIGDAEDKAKQAAFDIFCYLEECPVEVSRWRQYKFGSSRASCFTTLKELTIDARIDYHSHLVLRGSAPGTRAEKREPEWWEKFKKNVTDVKGSKTAALRRHFGWCQDDFIWNACKKIARRREIRDGSTVPAGLDDAQGVLARVPARHELPAIETQDAFEFFLALLPPALQSVVRLRVLQCMTNKAVARHLETLTEPTAAWGRVDTSRV